MHILWERTGNEEWKIKETCEDPYPLQKTIGLLHQQGSTKEMKVLPEGVPPDYKPKLMPRTLEDRVSALEKQNEDQDKAINLLVEALKASQAIIANLAN